MSLSSNGLILAVGAPQANGNHGATWVFAYDDESGSYIQFGSRLIGREIDSNSTTRQGKNWEEQI